MFVLVDSDSHESSGWQTIGGTFGDFRLVSYDSDNVTLTLEREGKSVVVGLKNAVIKDAGVALSGSLKRGDVAQAEIQRIVLRWDQEMALPTGPNTTLYITVKRRPDGLVDFSTRTAFRMPDGREETRSRTRMGGGRIEDGFTIGFADGSRLELKP